MEESCLEDGPAPVLIVDDYQHVRTMLRRMIERPPRYEERSDFQVVGEASNVEEAVDLVRSLAPRIVLLDSSLPGTDGAAATRRILAERPETRVICLTLDTLDGPHDSARRMTEAGAVTCLPKDASFERILAELCAVVRDASRT